MPQTTTPFICFLAINHEENGWSEAWHLPEHDIATARATAALLAEARAMLLAADVYIEWAAVRQVVSPYIEWAAIDGQISSLPQWGPVHSDTIGLLWRFETDQGRWGNHLLRGIDGSEIENEEWIRKPFYLAPGPYAIPAVPAAATKEELFRYVLALFRDRTCHAKEAGEDELGRMWWELSPWESAIYRKVSTRAFGSKYHRVSWEATDWTQSPGFTPCGTAVTVLRSCYYAECRFFSGAPAQEITYYFADPAAAVFPLQSIFWAWARDKEISNTEDPGETTGPGARNYSLGLAWGVAPGIVPDGTQDQFLGRTVCPWGEDPETPLVYRIPCDMPAPLPIRVNNDPQTVNDTNVTWITVDAATIALTSIAPGHVALEVLYPDTTINVALGIPIDDNYDISTLYFGNGDVYGTFSVGPGTLGICLGEGWQENFFVFGGEEAFYIGMQKNVRISHTEPLEIRGIAGGWKGRNLTLWNVGSYRITLKYDIAIADILNLIRTPDEEDWILEPFCNVDLTYNLGINCWEIKTPLERSFEYTAKPEAPLVRYAGLTGGVAPTTKIGPSPILASDDGAYIDGFLALKQSITSPPANVIDPGNAFVVQVGTFSDIVEGIIPKRLGQLINLQTLDNVKVTLKHGFAVALPAKALYCPGAVDYELKPHSSVLLFYGMYSGVGPFWVVLFTNQAPKMAYGESPAGDVDGVNPIFTALHVPDPDGMSVTVNGVLQLEGPTDNYTRSGPTVTFNALWIPHFEDVVQFTYQYQNF